VDTEILHVGDYDPSGVHIDAAYADDIEALIRDLGLPGEVSFTRLAVTPEQISSLGLTTAPPKKEDKRAFIGNETVQAEAIAPDDMAQIISDAILSRIDPDILRQTLKREAAIRERLTEALDQLDFDAGDVP
jgi:hypothetical protein